MTVKEQLVRVLFFQVTEINGDSTEEDLSMEISKALVEDNIRKAGLENEEAFSVETIEAEYDTEEIELNGAYVYSGKTMENWEFNRYKTIADAVRAAIHMIDAKIICNGNIIIYDSLNDEQAYYIDEFENTIKIVNLDI